MNTNIVTTGHIVVNDKKHSTNRETASYEWVLARLLCRVKLDCVFAPARQARRTLAPARALVNRGRGGCRAVHVRTPAVALIRVLDTGHLVPHCLTNN
jgi:hypothetical protein